MEPERGSAMVCASGGRPPHTPINQMKLFTSIAAAAAVLGTSLIDTAPAKAFSIGDALGIANTIIRVVDGPRSTTRAPQHDDQVVKAVCTNVPVGNPARSQYDCSKWDNKASENTNSQSITQSSSPTLQLTPQQVRSTAHFHCKDEGSDAAYKFCVQEREYKLNQIMSYSNGNNPGLERKIEKLQNGNATTSEMMEMMSLFSN